MRKLKVVDDGVEVENTKEWEKLIETLMSFDVMSFVPEQGKIPLQAALTMADIDLKTVPLIEMPELPPCLGLQPANIIVQVKDGYTIIAYDFKVVGAESVCLFDAHENADGELARQHRLREEKRRNKYPDMAKKGAEKGFKEAKKFA